MVYVLGRRLYLCYVNLWLKNENIRTNMLAGAVLEAKNNNCSLAGGARVELRSQFFKLNIAWFYVSPHPASYLVRLHCSINVSSFSFLGDDVSFFALATAEDNVLIFICEL